MLSIQVNDGVRLCDGVTRRELLRAGAIGLGGLTLPNLLDLEAAAKATAGVERKPGKARSIILFCTNGGTGQMDSFDPKPDAPAEVRGPYKGAATNVPGVRINEYFPRLARLADKYVLLRSLHHTDTVHPAAIYLTLCGARIPRNVTPESATMSREDRPHFGSALSQLLPGKKDLPSFIMLPAAMGPNGPEWPGQFAGFLGAAYDPYRVNSDPNEPTFSPGALASDPTLGASRLSARRSLREQVNAQTRYLEQQGIAQALTPHYAKAFDLISSPAAQKAFDIAAEPAAVRDRYGRHYFGQSCLLARRLVEAGVRLVQINWLRSNIGGRGGPGYDTHANGFKLCQEVLYPPTDQAFSTLLEDLEARGLLAETIVLFFNEFGRTPKINQNGGRDHWPQCYSILLAGGGLKGGQAYGVSDKIGAFPFADPVTPQDLLATLYQRLGVDLEKVLYDHLGRPHHLIDGKPIQAIV
jgi:hypothetical protein